MEALHAEWRGRADFLTVYIAEAHPHDGWRQDDPRWDVMQPTTTEERCAVARAWIDDLQPQTPYVVDPIENVARFAFAALPERLYVLEDGAVQYKGGKGPFDYHPEEVEAWLLERFDSDGSTAAKI
jgi:hypothetical protein